MSFINQELEDCEAYNYTQKSFNASLIDGYGFEAEFSPMGEIRTADKYRLAGGLFTGSALDPSIFISALTGTATAVVADRLMTLATGTTANSTGRVETVTVGQYTASNPNMFRAIIGVSNLGSINNSRKWGATTTTNGYFYYLKDTEFGIGYRKNGVETLVAQTNFNGDKTFVLNTNFNTYEIYYTTTKVYFSINDKLVHTAIATTAPFIADFGLKPAITNVNENGGTANVSVFSTAMSVNRIGPLVTNPIYKNITGAATTILKQSAGRLHSIIVNGAGVADQTLTIYDNIAASGTKIGTIDLGKIPSPISLQYNTYGIAFSTGLTMVTVGAAVNITIIYE